MLQRFLRNYSRTDGDAANATLISAEGMARTTADGLQNTAINKMLQLDLQKHQLEQLCRWTSKHSY
jgi:hypothetical protein